MAKPHGHIFVQAVWKVPILPTTHSTSVENIVDYKLTLSASPRVTRNTQSTGKTYAKSLKELKKKLHDGVNHTHKF